MIDVFPTLESPTNITLNAHVGIPCPFASRSATVFSITAIKENTTIIYLIVEYFGKLFTNTKNIDSKITFCSEDWRMVLTAWL